MRSTFLVCFLLIGHLAFAKTVVVVGGGLAGLTTAYELRKSKKNKNLQIEVYEAKDRPGGRVFTVRLDGKPAELGGENINDGGEALNIRRVVKELGLQVSARKRTRADLFFYDPVTAKIYAVSELRPFFPKISKEELKQTLTEGEKAAENLDQVVEFFFKRFASTDPDVALKREVIQRAVSEIVREFEGAETKTLSPRYAHGSLVWILGSYLKAPTGDPEPVDSVKGGNSQLVLALAKKLGSHLHLNKPLLKMKALNSGYELTFGGSAPEIVRADVVVLAIPGKPYANIEFGSNTIPEERLLRIQKLGYGTHAKILQPATDTKSAFPSSYTTGAMVWRRGDESWNTIYLSGAAGILVDAPTTEKSFAQANLTLPEPSKMKFAPPKTPTKIFESVQGPTSLSWALDPYIQGSYSHFRFDTRDDLEKTISYKGVEVLPLFEPIQNSIFFAGEHTTVDQEVRGTMEAAVASGIAAAKMVNINL